MQVTEDTLLKLAAQVPSLEHLLSGSLEVLRDAIRSAAAEGETTRWVVSHIVLGSALRLRALNASEDDRMQMYTEALRAFETALAACCEEKLRHVREPLPAAARAGVGAHREVHVGSDGVQLVVDATGLSGAEGNELLERAVRVFRDACSRAHRRMEFDEWFIGMSNLGCALTLLGCRTPGIAGIPLLEEAVDVFQQALQSAARERLLDERASAQANLSEALQALAERGMPSESVRYLEQAVDWRAAALSHFAPAEYRWILQLNRGRPC